YNLHPEQRGPRIIKFGKVQLNRRPDFLYGAPYRLHCGRSIIRLKDNTRIRREIVFIQICHRGDNRLSIRIRCAQPDINALAPNSLSASRVNAPLNRAHDTSLAVTTMSLLGSNPESSALKSGPLTAILILF